MCRIGADRAGLRAPAPTRPRAWKMVRSGSGSFLAGDLAAAKATCEAWLKAVEGHTRAEGHKCLANVEVGLAARAAGDAKADGRGGADQELAGFRRAVKHLDAAIELAPGDLSIHQGRLHLLRMAGLMAEMTTALEDSIRRHPGSDWLGVESLSARVLPERGDRKRACELQRKASCPSQTACVVLPASR